MSASLIQVEQQPGEPLFALTQAQARLRQMFWTLCRPSIPNATTTKGLMICLPFVQSDPSLVRS